MPGMTLEYRITAEELADMKRMFDRGEFVTDIARKHNSSTGTIASMAKRLGWDHSTRLSRADCTRKSRGCLVPLEGRLPSDALADIKRRYESGEPVNAIGAEYRIGSVAVTEMATRLLWNYANRPTNTKRMREKARNG